MRTLFRRSIDPGRPAAVVAATERHDGDFHLRHTDAATLATRQRRATGRTWVMVDQVHGVGVHTIAGSPTSRPVRADVIVAPRPDVAVAIWAADCAPLMLLGGRGGVAAVHAGWRGLAAGIVDLAVAALRAADDTVAAAVLGPVIHPCCYPFGAGELALVAGGVGVAPEAVSARTAGGAPALDVPAAVTAALGRHEIALDVVGTCTSCDRRWFSHRRGDGQRHAVVAWHEEAEVAGAR